MSLPLWAEWTFGISTVVLALAAAVLAGFTIWLAARTRRLTEDSKRLAEESKRLSEWQKHNQALTNFKQGLEQRVGYAHALNDVEAMAALISQFPPSPGEPAESRAAREQQETPDASSEVFESLVFTQQLDGRWVLEVLWASYPRIQDAFARAAVTYQLPVPPLLPDDLPSPLATWSAGPRYLLVTRKVEQTSETQGEEKPRASAPEPSEDA